MRKVIEEIVSSATFKMVFKILAIVVGICTFLLIGAALFVVFLGSG